MFAGDEKGPAVVDVTQKVARTKIAVFNPESARLHRLEQGAEQGAFLRMAIFTGKNIGDQALGGLIDHQGFAGQGPPLSLAQLLDAVLTGFEAVAIDNFEPVAFKPRSPLTAHVRDNGGKLTRAIAHQLCRRMRL